LQGLMRRDRTVVEGDILRGLRAHGHRKVWEHDWETLSRVDRAASGRRKGT